MNTAVTMLNAQSDAAHVDVEEEQGSPFLFLTEKLKILIRTVHS